MSSGCRRGVGVVDLEDWLDGLVEVDFRGRILDLDVAAARLFGQLAASAWAQGRRPHMGDTQIAAVAASNGFAVATRDAADFAPFGVSLIDPWADDGWRTSLTPHLSREPPAWSPTLCSPDLTRVEHARC